MLRDYCHALGRARGWSAKRVQTEYRPTPPWASSMPASRLALSLCALLAASSASAQEQEKRGCAGLPKDADRLACYDTVNGRPPAVTAEEPTLDVKAEEQPTASTKEIVGLVAPTDYRLVDPADLFVAPSKFIDKPVEIRRAHCFYADRSEYRCLAPGREAVIVIAPNISPPDAKSLLENDCGAIKAMQTVKCQRTIRFVPAAHAQDAVNAMTPRVVIVSKMLEIAPTPKRK